MLSNCHANGNMLGGSSLVRINEIMLVSVIRELHSKLYKGDLSSHSRFTPLRGTHFALIGIVQW